MHYLHHAFNKLKSIFQHTDNEFTYRQAANKVYEVT